MNNTTPLELKCDGIIPFQSDLTAYLNNLLVEGPMLMGPVVTAPDSSVLSEALKGRPVFLTIGLGNPARKIRPSILKKIKNIFRKDIVGIFRIGKKEITYVLI